METLDIFRLKPNGRCGLAALLPMNGSCNQFLSCTCFAIDQDRRVRGRYCFHMLENFA